MIDRRPPVLAVLSILMLFVGAGSSRAGEIIDGNAPPTVRNNMHSCPPGYIMTGVDVAANHLLCTGPFEDGQSFLTVNEVINAGVQATNRSALIDFAGRCVDVNTNNNNAQVFDCHAGPNQSWIYEVDGEIRGVNGLCLEANNNEIQTWPNLTTGQVRRAAVRVATCNGGVHQKWSVTEAGQIRMFSDMCLDIVGGSSFNQAALQIFPCHGGPNQRWLSSF